MTVKSTIKHRRGTTAQWESRNPILKDAEFGVDLDTGKFKVGNGVSRWLDLPYFVNEEDLEELEGIPGPQGAPGPQGIQGEAGTEGPRGLQGDTGPEGPQGTQGSTGTPGTSLTIVDQVPTFEDLPLSAAPSEGYLLEDGSLWFYGATSGWVEVGELRGPEGPQGLQGTQGPQGEIGPIGPEGPRGFQGIQGLVGERGLDGYQGVDGAQGPPGESVDISVTTFPITTEVLTAGVSEKSGITISTFFGIAEITATSPCRVRLYSDTVSQTMDVNFGDVVKRYVLVASGGSGTTYQPNVWMPDEA